MLLEMGSAWDKVTISSLVVRDASVVRREVLFLFENIVQTARSQIYRHKALLQNGVIQHDAK